MRPLPIDAVLPEVLARLREAGAVVLEAPPGAGKTTRVPAAILDAGLAGDGEVVVLEPRRLATRMAAAFVAAERGERLGGTVGYQVRFDQVAGPRTRLRYLTEGVFSRRLVGDPRLRGVGAVVLDEFHERHLAADLALACLRRLREGPRPDLRVVVMSATLDAAPVAAYLRAPRVASEGRAFPVEIEHLARRDDRPLEAQVASAVARGLDRGPSGDALVFLPGAAEIRRAAGALEGLARVRGLLVLPLHGDLPAEEQDRAVRPADRPKVVLSTNVAETGVTVDGVSLVVDAGLARVARHDPWTGVPVLRVEKVSRASAAQRAGRAGRTRPGLCLRLYTQADHDLRPAHDAPEVRRLDLAGAALELRALGVRDLAAFPWFEAPEPGALAAAEDLLTRLRAVAADGTLTPLGSRLLAFPLHPRLARLVVEAERRGVAAEGAAVAALLAEGDPRARRGPLGAPPRAGSDDRAGPSDLLARLDDLAAARAGGEAGARRAGLDPAAARAVQRAREGLDRLADRRAAPRPADPDAAVRAAVLAAFPDRVARRRRPGEPEVWLCGGGSAMLAPDSVVREAGLLVAVEVEDRARGGPLVRVASAIEPEWLLEAAPERLRDEESLEWDARAQRVEFVRRTCYDELVLEASRRPGAGAPGAAALLAQEAARAGLDAFCDREALDRFLARTAFVAREAPEAGVRERTVEDARAVLCALCEGRSSFREVREAGLLDALRSALAPAERGALDRLAPESVALPGGWRPRVGYAAGRPPWIEAAVQDFFGQREGPRVLAGRVPVVLHLLAPSRRPLQVTTDLAGFWERHWPAARREMARRYPRHAWPEDPRTAQPPARRARRGA